MLNRRVRGGKGGGTDIESFAALLDSDTTKGNRKGQRDPDPVNVSIAEDAPSWKEMMVKVMPYLRPADRKHMLFSVSALVAVILQKMVNVLPPLAIKSAVDIISENAKDGIILAEAPIRPVVMPIVTFFCLKLVSMMLSVIKDLSKSNVSLDAQRRFGVTLFSHLHHLSLSYHLEKHIGEITSIMNRGVGAISTFIDVFLFSLAPTVFEAVLVSAVFWKLGAPSIAASTLITVAIYVTFTVFVTNTRIRFRRKLIEAMDAVGKKETETLVNYETVAMFGKTEAEISKYSDLRKTYQDCRVEMLGIFQALSFGQEIIKLTGVCSGLLIAAIATIRGDPPLSPGSFVVVQMYINQLFQPLTFIAMQYKQVTQAFTELEKAISMLGRVSEVQDMPNAIVWKPPPSVLSGEIVVDNVSFHYKSTSRRKPLGASLEANVTKEDDEEAPEDLEEEVEDGAGGVSGISFRVPAGKTAALVGRSGSGKTTLMRMILRMYDPDNGTVTIDGQEVKKLTQKSLRENIGVVAQETVLFNDSLRNNILYGKDDASEEDIWRAVKTAALEEFVSGLPDKLDTVVGERGLKLSGGERQRVGLARCVIRDPQLILLDEATSALDSGTELEIQRNISEICKGRTTIMIAHRLSTARKADEIIVLEKGKIVERGSHSRLLAIEGGRYAKMWRDQTEPIVD